MRYSGACCCAHGAFGRWRGPGLGKGFGLGLGFYASWRGRCVLGFCPLRGYPGLSSPTVVLFWSLRGHTRFAFVLASAIR